MTEPYFVSKAREVFITAKGDPNVSGPLADWAQAAHAIGDSRRGVVVAKTGEILAETRHVPATVGSPGATYVTALTDERFAEVKDFEIGLALGGLHRISGQPVIHVKYWEVCQGAGQFIRTDSTRRDRDETSN